MSLYITDSNGKLVKVAGGGELVAESVALNTTRTGQNDTVVEYYMSSDGKSWYRKWASGWKECGGVYDRGTNTVAYVNTLTMPITFSNNTYSLNVTLYKLNDDQYCTTSYWQVYYKSTNQFKVAVNGASSDNVSRGYDWYACGF